MCAGEMGGLRCWLQCICVCDCGECVWVRDCDHVCTTVCGYVCVWDHMFVHDCVCLWRARVQFCIISLGLGSHFVMHKDTQVFY